MVIAPFEDSFYATAFRVDFIDKEIRKLWQKRMAGAGEREKLKEIFSLAFYPNSYKVIFTLGPQEAVSRYERIFWDRDDPKKLIDEAEIDNLTSGALLKLFDERRRVAMKQFNLSELEVLLADVKVHEFKIDGHRIINPLKHTGKKIEIFLNETFISRPRFAEWVAILPKRVKAAVFLGAGEATCHLISRFSRKQNFIFAGVGERRADLFIATKGGINFLDSFNWGRVRLAEKLAKYLDISPVSGEAILAKIVLGETSPALRRKFGEILSGEVLALLRHLKKAVSRTGVPVLYTDLPALLVSKIFPKIIKTVDTEMIADFFGFRLNGELQNTGENVDFLSLTSILEFYFLPEEDLVNHLARRRMRWLMP